MFPLYIVKTRINTDYISPRLVSFTTVIMCDRRRSNVCILFLEIIFIDFFYVTFKTSFRLQTYECPTFLALIFFIYFSIQPEIFYLFERFPPDSTHVSLLINNKYVIILSLNALLRFTAISSYFKSISSCFLFYQLGNQSCFVILSTYYYNNILYSMQYTYMGYYHITLFDLIR